MLLSWRGALGGDIWYMGFERRTTERGEGQGSARQAVMGIKKDVQLTLIQGDSSTTSSFFSFVLHRIRDLEEGG